MPDTIVGAAGAPAPVTSGFLGGFPPAHLEQPAEEAPVQEAAPEVPAAPAPKPSLADDIRRQRADRQAREQATQRSRDMETKLQEREAEIERLRRDNDFERDPIAFAKARNWDKEKQALMGQTLLYDLVPDKAPQDLRWKLHEAKVEREKREEAESRQAAERTAHAEREQEQFNGFVAAVEQAAGSFEVGSFPESQDWFGEDHDTYVRSLVATSLNMARAAAAAGQVADLTPASIARTLEAEVARKMKARDDRAQQRAKPAQPVVKQVAAPVAPGGKQPTESTKGTYGGTPSPRAISDAERVARATAVLNKPR